MVSPETFSRLNNRCPRQWTRIGKAPVVLLEVAVVEVVVSMTPWKVMWRSIPCPGGKVSQPHDNVLLTSSQIPPCDGGSSGWTWGGTTTRMANCSNWLRLAGLARNLIPKWDLPRSVVVSLVLINCMGGTENYETHSSCTIDKLSNPDLAIVIPSTSIMHSRIHATTTRKNVPWEWVLTCWNIDIREWPSLRDGNEFWWYQS